ncbi:hypothetical protein SLEP1_g9436 [Rubroshorea leprosula]|uniref:Uncharacterized protein n=1 Tax=Rubroshorea leprosula TaxID=152421 RepID=A0AAV5ICV7_9ROSI|nr:hypothetical protein SLEP1_g9436 [Rubroshorea leprosula]
MVVVTHEKRKSSPIPKQKFSFFENVSKTVAKRFINVTFLDVDLKRARNEKELAKQNFNDLTFELEKVKEELATGKKVTELEEKKRKKCEENLAKVENELAKVQREVELADEAGQIVLPPSVEYEFVAIDKDEAGVAGGTEVGDNIAKQEVDKQHQVID